MVCFGNANCLYFEFRKVLYLGQDVIGKFALGFDWPSIGMHLEKIRACQHVPRRQTKGEWKWVLIGWRSTVEPLIIRSIAVVRSVCAALILWQIPYRLPPLALGERMRGKAWDVRTKAGCEFWMLVGWRSVISKAALCVADEHVSMIIGIQSSKLADRLAAHHIL